jgi:hypothetical protein
MSGFSRACSTTAKPCAPSCGNEDCRSTYFLPPLNRAGFAAHLPSIDRAFAPPMSAVFFAPQVAPIATMVIRGRSVRRCCLPQKTRSSPRLEQPLRSCDDPPKRLARAAKR